MTVTEYPEFTQTKEFRSGVSIETNFQIDDTTRMSVDSAGAAHIMSLLTDLYSDQEGSVIREYISNAYDSHAASGQTRPVEVALPGAFDPTFVVKDFGTGMSAEDIRDIYGSYGKSTKRDKFDQIGAFGLGCKSALTMTQQFTLIAVKNGRKSVAIIARGEDGVGEIKMISADQPTDEPNGVEVKIPVQRHQLFRSKAEKFFFALPKGTILVDGKPPAKSLFDEDFLHIEDLKTYISRESATTWGSSGAQGFSVIAGGVLYPVDLNELEIPYDVRRNSPFYGAIGGGVVLPSYATIPVASVDLTPSREDIRYSERTKKFLIDLIKAIGTKFNDLLKKDVASSPDRFSALKRLHHYQEVLGKSWGKGATWNGEPIVTQVPASGYAIKYRDYANSTSMDALGAIFLVGMIGLTTPIYFVEGPAEIEDDDKNQEEWEKFVKTSRRDFRGWRTHNQKPGSRLYVFRGPAPTSPWFTELNAFEKVEVADLAQGAKEWRKERRAEGAKNRTSGNTPAPITYPVVSIKDAGQPVEVNYYSAKDLKDGTVFVEDGFDHRFDTLDGRVRTDLGGIQDRIESLGAYGVDFVYVAASRKVDALASRAKGTTLISYRTYVADQLTALIDSLNEDQIRLCTHMMTTYAVQRFIEGFKVLSPYLDEIGDEDLKKFYESLKAVENISGKFETLINLNGLFYEYRNKYQGLDLTDTTTKYALLDMNALRHYNERNIKHTVIYMKAVNSQGKDV